ncbi:MAG: hypothetical protein CVV52_14565 [Spirochaetae bacterium HGW-Spirochaetae-8]|nr:MAG: hypothetical protein CVV52_14565 [Spirochaetae bacterium HGW-Spirochaetae-8]
MRSELINDIFSVETEAERIVAEARQLAREQVSRSHEEGAALVRIAAQEARESRFQAIKEAQLASANRIAEFQESLLPKERDPHHDETLADTVSNAIVDFLCLSQLSEQNKR